MRTLTRNICKITHGSVLQFLVVFASVFLTITCVDIPDGDDGHLRPEEYAACRVLHPRAQPEDVPQRERPHDTGPVRPGPVHRGRDIRHAGEEDFKKVILH